MAAADDPAPSSAERDLAYMRMALREAELALARRETPVGCVFVDASRERVVARGSNRTNETYNVRERGGSRTNATSPPRSTTSAFVSPTQPTAHAELVAIDQLVREFADGADGAEEDSGRRRRPRRRESGSESESESGSESPPPRTLAATLRACEVFVTVEPCIMCAGALASVGVRRVVYGCPNDKFGGCGSVAACHDGSTTGIPDSSTVAPSRASPLPFPCVAGVCREEAIALLKRFYETTNLRAPRPSTSP